MHMYYILYIWKVSHLVYGGNSKASCKYLIRLHHRSWLEDNSSILSAKYIRGSN